MKRDGLVSRTTRCRRRGDCRRLPDRCRDAGSVRSTCERGRPRRHVAVNTEGWNSVRDAPLSETSDATDLGDPVSAVGVSRARRSLGPGRQGSNTRETYENCRETPSVVARPPSPLPRQLTPKRTRRTRRSESGVNPEEPSTDTPPEGCRPLTSTDTTDPADRTRSVREPAGRTRRWVSPPRGRHRTTCRATGSEYHARKIHR